MRVAVLGASGFVGSALVETLGDAHDVVAVARRAGSDANVEWVAADLTRESEAARALAGADVVVHLVHSLGQPDYERRDVAIAENVAAAAESAKVSQIVYLGGLGDESTADLSKHLRSRHETGRALARGSVPVTTVRAGVVVGRGSAAFETIVALVDRLPAMVCPRWVSVPTQPIALRDVVSALAGVVGLERAHGETYDIGGPEVMTYREMIDRIARVRGKHPLIVEVPVLTPRLSSWWLHLVTPVKASVARPLIDGLRNPTVAQDDRIHELVPMPATPFDDAVREALAD